MAPHTPRRNYAANSFITLSVSKESASRLFRSLNDGPLPVDTTPTIDTKNEPKTTPKKPPRKRDSRPSISIATPDSTPRKEPRGLSQLISPSSSVPKRCIVSFKYKSIITPQSSGQIAEDIHVNKAHKQSPVQSVTTEPEFPIPLDGQSDRRSSTASLTDAGTRSSGRARKLTTKAQALAGTRFLPSLQSTPVADGTPSPTFEVQPEQRDTDENKPQSPAKEDVVPPSSEPAEINVVEVPLESVETAITRTSARERKPTTRAIESETTRNSRKRPASPLGSERAPKMAKNSPSVPTKPSKLRHSVIHVEDGASHGSPDVVPGNSVQSDGPEAVENGISTPDKAVEDLPPTPISSGTETAQDVNQSETTTTLPQTTAQIVEEQSLLEAPRCNLACLAPSTRLLVFARMTAELPDSDGESDEEEIDLDLIMTQTDDSTKLFEKACHDYCQCQKGYSNLNPAFRPSESILSPEKIGQKESSSHISVIDAPARAATVQKSSHPSKRAKRVDNQQQHQNLGPKGAKRQRTVKSQPGMVRQTSSFEQRMQTDFLASQQAQSPSIENKAMELPRGSSSEEHNKSALTSANTTARILRIPIPDDSLANGVHRDDNNTEIASKMSNLEDIIPKNNERIDVASPKPIAAASTTHSFQEQYDKARNPSTGSPSVETANVKISPTTSKSLSKTGNKQISNFHQRASISTSMRDKDGHENGPTVKQFQPIAPPQPKSIKLRFTSAAKRYNNV